MIATLPSWVLLLLTLVVVMVPIQVGQRLGVRSVKRGAKVHDAPIASVVGAALGLLAFLLAFTFQIASNRFDTRKQLLLDEVTSVHEAYLRASLLPEPQRTASQKLLSEYVDLRVQAAPENGIKHLAIDRSQQIQRALWSQAEELAQMDRGSEVYALFTSSVNEVISLHNKRVVVLLHYKIPSVVLWVQYFIVFFAMLILGYQFGVNGKGSLLVQVSLALIFSGVLWLILAQDHPEEGILKISQQPWFALQAEIHGRQ